MRVSTKFLLFSISTVMTVSCLAGCDDDAPTMDTCIQYGDDPEACEAAGCTVTTGRRVVFRNGRYVAFLPHSCFPPENRKCSSVRKNFFGWTSYCDFTGSYPDIVVKMDSCQQDLGGDWEVCPPGYRYCGMDCYPLHRVCAEQATPTNCLAEYCTWVSGAVKAVFENGSCTGWNETPVSFCTAPVPESVTLIYRFTENGTEMYRMGETQTVPNAEWFKISEHPDPWLHCYGHVSVDPEICASCPTPDQ